MCRLAQTLAVTKVSLCELQQLQNAGLRKMLVASVNEIPEQPGRIANVSVHERASSSEVSCWLALRAGVLRRAGSWSGTTQKLRAEINASAASQGNQIARRTLSFVSNTPSTQFELMENECYTSLANTPGNMWSLRKTREATRTLHPKENGLRFASLASPMAHGCQTHYFQLRR